MNPSELFIVYLKDLSSASAGVFLAAFRSETLQTFVGFTKAIFIIISIIFVVLIIWLVRQTNMIDGWKRKYYQWYLPGEPSQKSRKMSDIWQTISELAENSSDEVGYRKAVLAADDILGSALTNLSFTGETLAEKLHHITPAEIRNLGRLVQAHKVTAALRQNPKARLSQNQAREMIDVYTTSLEELGVIVG